MTEQNLAKVDYQKPLDDVPYKEVTAAKEQYHKETTEKLARIVGDKNISDEPAVLEKYARDKGLQRAGKPAFVVFPEKIEQICDLVKYANETKLPVIPSSSGTHTNGATLPRMGGLIIDLSGWKQIYKIDHRNRAVRIQPGVTYDELQEALEKEGLRAMIPLLPRKDQSVLTAHIEAHPMLIPEFNYSEPVYTAEIVMPTGTLFRTGAAAPAPPEQAQTDLVGPWGPGFDWNRLYTRAQGTLGIITWANIMAEPLPKKQKIYFTASRSLDALTAFTYDIQKKWIGYECFILNKTNLAAIIAERDEDIALLQYKLPEYVQIFCIGGLKRFPEERIAYQEADFLEASQAHGLNPLPTIPEAPNAAAFFEKGLRRCWAKEVYWKDRLKGASADIFFITTMNRAAAFIAAMQQEAAKGRYNLQDIGVYLQPIENGRAAHLEFTIAYNPDDKHERQIAEQLYHSASERMYALGGLFTRAYGAWGSMVSGKNAVQQQTARMVKEILDPNNIMNPGKLGL